MCHRWLVEVIPLSLPTSVVENTKVTRHLLVILLLLIDRFFCKERKKSETCWERKIIACAEDMRNSLMAIGSDGDDDSDELIPLAPILDICLEVLFFQLLINSIYILIIGLLATEQRIKHNIMHPCSTRNSLQKETSKEFLDTRRRKRKKK